MVSGPGQNASVERARRTRDAGGERVERGGRADQHRRRHVAAAALGVEQRLHRVGGRRRRRRCRRRCRSGSTTSSPVLHGGARPRRAPASRSSSASRSGTSCSSVLSSWAVGLIVPAGRSRSARDLPGRGGRVPRSSARSPAKTAGADSPCTSACSTPTTPPGRSSRAAPPLDHAGSRRARRSPDHSASVRVVVAGLGGDRLAGLERDVRRVADHDVDGAVEVGERVGHVALAQVDAGAGEVARGPGVGALVQLDGVDAGAGHLVGDGLRRSRRSRCTGRPRPGVGSRQRPPRSTAQPASSSVSGRGTKTPGPTAARRSGTPRCRSGAGAARGPRGAPPARRTPRRREPVRRPTSAQAGPLDAEDVGEQHLGVVLRGLAPRPRAAAAAAVGSEQPSGRHSALRRGLDGVEPGGEVGLDAGVDDGAARSPSSTWSRL